MNTVSILMKNLNSEKLKENKYDKFDGNLVDVSAYFFVI